MLPAATIETRNRLSNSFPGKADTERRMNFENVWSIYLWRYTLHY